MICSIQNMKHRFWTNHGDSKLVLEKPFSLPCYQGILQGNRAALATWVLISTPLFNMLQTAPLGRKFTSPISKQYSHVAGYAYVDDMDFICMTNRDII